MDNKKKKNTPNQAAYEKGWLGITSLSRLRSVEVGEIWCIPCSHSTVWHGPGGLLFPRIRRWGENAGVRLSLMLLLL